ncbi:nitrous oxide reductase family maturation protein NosD [Amycolatopsis sp. NPDC059027]|uniref:right-handed parallel beta-helix repeat-containing protein n=1 Tax=unclassified Amycolatopsis TaxID=2618356 RepID=UPI00366CD56C
MRSLLSLLVLLLLGVLATSCSASDVPVVRPATAAVIRVPQAAPTITKALETAHEGDLVLVSPGVYHESVYVRVRGVVLRGVDRNDVVIDGETKRDNGIVIAAPGVSVENLTVRDHRENGVLVTGVTGFRVSYVTASNNGNNGIAASQAQHGVIEQNYTSGSAESGIFVGACEACETVVRDNVAEHDATGFQSARASRLRVTGNRFTGNRVGLQSTSDTKIMIAGNVVGNDAERAGPARYDGVFGRGIVLAGGRHNVVTNNRVTGNPAAGIVLDSTEDLGPVGNRIVGNLLSGNRVDLAYTASGGQPGGANCLADNQLATTVPRDLVMPCPAGGKEAVGERLDAVDAPRGQAAPRPPRQPGLPDAATAPPRPAFGLPEAVRAGSIRVPGPELLVDRVGTA